MVTNLSGERVVTGCLPQALVVVCCWVLALGCRGRAQSPSEVNDPPQAAASARSAPSPLASASAVARPVVAPAPATVVELTLLSELACEAELFTLAGRTLVACGQALMSLDEAGALRSDGGLVAGLKLDVTSIARTELLAVAGRWPEAAWAATSQAVPERNVLKLRFFRWRKDHWAPSGAAVEQGMPEERVVFPWNEDGLAALVGNAFRPTQSLVFTVKPAPLPALTAAEQSKRAQEQYPCKQMLIAPQAWAVLVPGDVMIFSGQLCGAERLDTIGAAHERGRRLGLERLRAGEKQGRVSLLPLPSDVPREMTWNVVGAAALAADDAFVAATGVNNQRLPDEPFREYSYFAHWDGKAWQHEQPPFVKPQGLWAAAFAFFATDEHGALWSRRDAAWAPVTWHASNPRAAVASGDEPLTVAWRGRISQLAADDAGRIWLVRQEETPGSVVSRIYRLRL